jgi:hypothetical protein
MRVRLLSQCAAVGLALLLVGCGAEFAEKTVVPQGCAGEDDAGGSVCEEPPADECISEDELRRWDPEGLCVEGECSYTSFVEQCAGRCDGATASCVCPTCDEPPADACNEEGGEIVVYEEAGTCQEDGSCRYPSQAIPCAHGCDPGTAECNCPTCDEPPADACDGDELVLWEPAGTCVDGGCEYDSQTIVCESGCDPATLQCDCPTCDEPPADECISDDDLLVWSDQGSCVDSQCEYDSQTVTCPAGCDAATNTCACPDCDEPPAAQCISADELEVWEPAGTCQDDKTCAYDSRTVVCAHGCDASTDFCSPPDLDAEASTWGTEFWIAFMENLPLNRNGPPQLTFLVGAATDTQGQLEIPATGLTIPFTVSAGEFAELDLSDTPYYPQGSDVIDDKGIRIVADDPVTVTGAHKRIYQSDASLILPLEELDDEYVVLAAKPAHANYPSQLGVLAVEDGTDVDITPSVVDTDGSRPAGQTFTVSLDAGEVYQLKASTGNLQNTLSGTTITAQQGKPIAVFSGAQAAHAECGPSNHVWEQNLPLSRWGREYLLMPYYGQSDLIEIAAAEDGTEVQIDCGTPITLDRGEVHEAEITDPTRITSSAPVGVAQFNRGQTCNDYGFGDPSILIPPPTALYTTYAQFRHTEFLRSTSTTDDPPEAFVNLAASSGATVLLDGTDVSGAFSPAPADRSSAQFALADAVGDHVVYSDEPLSGVAYAYSHFDAYTWHLGYNCDGCVAELDAAPVCP